MNVLATSESTPERKNVRSSDIVASELSNLGIKANAKPDDPKWTTMDSKCLSRSFCGIWLNIKLDTNSEVKDEANPNPPPTSHSGIFLSPIWKYVASPASIDIETAPTPAENAGFVISCL